MLGERVLTRLDEVLLRLVGKARCYLRSMTEATRLIMRSFGKLQGWRSYFYRNIEGRAEVVVKDSDTGALLHIV